MDIAFDLAKLLNVSDDEAKKLTIGVAVSGGRDSVALLHMLRAAGYQVVAINVEHGIRGEESLRDSKFVAELCASLGVPLFSYRVDAPAFARENGYTLEQGARTLRYRVFDSALEEGKCDCIALAHHLDDQVETVLMRILRGTGIKGLVGMRAVSGRYIRPLLGVSREEIDEYCKQNGLAYVEDSTNADTAYTRNFLRGELAALKTRFPALGEAFKRLSASALEAEEFIDGFVPEPVVEGGEAFLNISDLSNVAVAKRAIVKAAGALGVRQDIEERHFPLVLSLANAESGKCVQLTHRLEVYRQGDRLAFALRRDEDMPEETPFEAGEYEKFGIRVEQLSAESLPADLKGDGKTLFVDADSVPDGAVIRRRRDGDVISKFGGGRKSLGDFLTDKKVPNRKRDGIAVVAYGNNILAVAGVDISSECKITAQTKRAYKITLCK